MNGIKPSIRLVAATVCAGWLLAGCGGGGDVNLNASSSTVINDNSTTSGGGGSDNPCANYTDPQANTVRRGTFDGTNCNYSSDFVGENNPLTVDLTIPFISGVHIFEDALFVGLPLDGTDPNQPIPQDGEGPTLTIRAGARLAWLQANDYLLVNRGSRIVAEGSPQAPIILTGYQDAVLGSAGKFATQLWGGVVINGNGITNKCSDQQRAEGTCHIQSEGKPSFYGGNNNDESSGVLRYVQVKHAGFEVAPGDELNGITFNAVGSGTVVENIQVYAAFDDGVEFFGGAVDVNNLVALYVQDDSIDWADGWVGSVNKALIIQAPDDGDRCIEADNQGDNFVIEPLSNGKVTNMTCIPSGARLPVSTHGDSMGVEMRRGTLFAVEDSIIFDGYAIAQLAQNATRCFRVTDTETAQRAVNGQSSVKSTVIACQVPTSNGTNWSTVTADSVAQWITNTGTGSYPGNTGNVIFDDPTNADLQLLDSFYTATSFTDLTGDPFTVDPVGDEDYIGAVTRDDDWTAGWTFGLDDLWF
jgi:hypothetical protein